MFRTLCFILLSLLALTDVALAARKVIELDGAKYSLELPLHWHSNKNVLGLSLVIAGPDLQNKRRPAVSLISTKRAGLKFDENLLSQESEAYYKGRKSWLAKIKGELVELIPSTKNVLPQLPDSNVIGFRYRLGNLLFEEKTIYAFCPNGRMLHVKTLFPEESGERIKNQIKNLVSSIRCES